MKTCGQCGKPAPLFAKVGDVCPYCGARWGYERGVTIPYGQADGLPGLRKFIWIVLVIGLLAAMIVPAITRHRLERKQVPAPQAQPK